MTPAFLAAIVDTLLPGESAAAGDRQVLPAGTAAGIDPTKYRWAFQLLMESIARAAGGAETFAAASEETRVAILQTLQRAEPGEFARLLAAVLPDYYESPAVLGVLGWRSAPPQPQGHDVPAMAQDVAQKLDRVRRQGQRWRS